MPSPLRPAALAQVARATARDVVDVRSSGRRTPHIKDPLKVLLVRKNSGTSTPTTKHLARVCAPIKVVASLHHFACKAAAVLEAAATCSLRCFSPAASIAR